MKKLNTGKRKNRKSVSKESERNNSFWTGYRCTVSVMLDLRAFIKGDKKPEDIPECKNIN